MITSDSRMWHKILGNCYLIFIKTADFVSGQNHNILYLGESKYTASVASDPGTYFDS